MVGFDFSNYNRNAALHAKGVPLPKATSTGTTIVGCIFDNGVVVSDDGIYQIVPSDDGLSGSSLNLTLTTDRRGYQSYEWSYSRRQGALHIYKLLEDVSTLIGLILHRTARNCTTSPPKSGVLEPVQLQTPNSQPP
jgi:hypothetical protein